MEKIRKDKIDDLIKGSFVVIESWYLDRWYEIAKVIKVDIKKQKAEFKIIAKGNDKFYINELDTCFMLINNADSFFIEKDGMYITESGRNLNHITGFYLITDTVILENMVLKEKEQKEKDIKKLREELKSFKKTMKQVGLLKIQKKII